MTLTGPIGIITRNSSILTANTVVLTTIALTSLLPFAVCRFWFRVGFQRCMYGGSLFGQYLNPKKYVE